MPISAMDAFLSCDWGTSSFRLRLVQTTGLLVVAEEINSDGIAQIFKKWTAENKPESERLFFYQSHLHAQIKKLEKKAGYSLHELPLLVSGMASSSIGMLTLPYKELPFKTDGSDLNVSVIEPSNRFSNKLILVSGAATGDDVMRGEETLLIGCDAEASEEGIYIFPGTHAKHIQVGGGVAQHFKTYMTGEFFELLSTKSILSNSIEKDETNNPDFASPHFEKGILEGSASNLLNATFHVRTADLFKKHTRPENNQYLSGLVIGAELKELAQTPSALVLVCGKKLEKKYKQGLMVLGLHKNLKLKNADLALIKGQLRIYEAIKCNRASE